LLAEQKLWFTRQFRIIALWAFWRLWESFENLVGGCLGFVASVLGRPVDIRGVLGKITEVSLRGVPGFFLGVSLGGSFSGFPRKFGEFWRLLCVPIWDA
jgi:hypothetical protein